MAMACLRLVLLAALCVSVSFHSAWAGELVVSGAASLTGAMTEIKNAFEAAHQDCKIFANFAASGQLLQQIEAGAPVDVYIPADETLMDRAADRGLIDAKTRVDVASNELLLAVPANSSTVSSPQDLTKPAVCRVALGEPDAVPAGSYTQQSLRRLGLWDPLAPKMIYGLTVKQVLDYLALGEVDAAFIFTTEAQLAGNRIRVVKKMEGHSPIMYPVAVLTASTQKKMAQEFITFLQGKTAQDIFTKYGFKKPKDSIESSSS